MSYQVPKWYDWTFKITSFDAGEGGRLRPSCQMKLQQEAGELQLQQGGINYQVMVDKGMVFVVTRSASIIHRAPILDEIVRLRTWHRNTKGAQFVRCYQFFDNNDNLLIESSSAFALVDPVQHRLLRPSVFFKEFGDHHLDELHTDCPSPEKLVLPCDLVHLGDRPVRWSDIDYNGHMNNTVYADVACDFVPDSLQNKRITAFALSYLKEANRGDVLSVKGKVENNETVWICADHERGRCFDARLDFSAE